MNYQEKDEKAPYNSVVSKTKVNTTRFFISKAFIESYIKHEEFYSVNNVLRECNEMKR